MNVDNKTVGKVRAEQEAREEIPHVEKRKDTKGRKQPARRLGARHKCWQCDARAPVGEVRQHNYAAYEEADVWLHDFCVAAFEASEADRKTKQPEEDDAAATADAMKAKHAAAAEQSADQFEMVEHPEQIRVNILDTIDQSCAVVRAYKKILKTAAPLEQGAKDEISTAIGRLITKWQSLQASLAPGRAMAASTDPTPIPANLSTPQFRQRSW